MDPVPLSELVGRMITTRARVGFTDCDPLGHMTSSRYLELAVNHRMTAVTEQLGFDTFAMARQTGLAFVNHEVSLLFKSSAQFDDPLVVDSWIDQIKSLRMTVKVRISHGLTGDVCCIVTISTVVVDLANAVPVVIPPTYRPIRQVELGALPWAPGHPRAAGGHVAAASPGGERA